MCSQPMMTALNFRNSAPCKGLVKKSANISSVGQYSMDISPLSIRSLTKKYLMWICLELPVHDFLPFFSMRVALTLSWYPLTFGGGCPWASTKYRIQIGNGR
mmetsp:Transcript_19868/g.22532  ORF Transcript_19868/g.22532 Transcript_19868/m.22532 type:complete len:102 (+) Transcript_19868:298-603(+)